MNPLEILSKLASSPVGEAVIGVVALCVVYATFGAGRAVLGLWKRHAAKTETKVDDRLVDMAEDVLDKAEGRAIDRVERK